MQVPLDGELDHQQHAEHLVAGAVGGIRDGAREDVAQGEGALRELVVRAAEVEHGQRDGLQGRGGGDGREVAQQVRPDPCLPAAGGGKFCVLLTLIGGATAQGLKTPLEEPAKALSYRREDARDYVRQDNAACDVRRTPLDRRQLPRGALELHKVAVFLAEGSVPGKGGEGKVYEGGDGSQLGAQGVGGTGAAQVAVEVCDAICEVACEVGVLLLGADDVWGGGEGIW